MEKLKVTLNRDVLKDENKTLERNFKKGENINLMLNYYSFSDKNDHVFLNEEGNSKHFKLPLPYLNIAYNNKEYCVFMTEKCADYIQLYCKKPVFKHLEVLSEIQQNSHLIDENTGKENKPSVKPESDLILKIKITPTEVKFEMISIRDIKPLF